MGTYIDMYADLTLGTRERRRTPYKSSCPELGVSHYKTFEDSLLSQGVWKVSLVRHPRCLYSVWADLGRDFLECATTSQYLRSIYPVHTSPSRTVSRHPTFLSLEFHVTLSYVLSLPQIGSKLLIRVDNSLLSCYVCSHASVPPRRHVYYIAPLSVHFPYHLLVRLLRPPPSKTSRNS